MPQINLLPPSLSKTKKLDKSPKKSSINLKDRLKFVPIWLRLTPLVNIVLFVFLTGFIFYLINGRKSYIKNFYKLDNQNIQLGIPQQLKDVIENKENLKEWIKIIENIKAKWFIISEKLNIISDILPDGVWLSELSIEKKGMTKGVSPANAQNSDSISLRLKAKAFSLKEQELLDIAGQFLNSLKKDEKFSLDFKNITLGKLNRTKIGNFEILEFNIECEGKL